MDKVACVILQATFCKEKKVYQINLDKMCAALKNKYSLNQKAPD